jgi:hypothetical protein
VLRWLCAGVVAVALTLFALLLVTGNYTEEGPVVVRFSQAHGVHVGDLVVLAVWAVALAALVRLTTSGRTASRQ